MQHVTMRNFLKDCNQPFLGCICATPTRFAFQVLCYIGALRYELTGVRNQPASSAVSAESILPRIQCAWPIILDENI